MTDQTWLAFLAWAAVIIAGYPVAAIIMSEATRRIRTADSILTRPFKVVQNFLLPAAAIWILVHKLMAFPADNVGVKIVDTIAGIVVLYAVLLLAQALLMAFQGRIEGGPRAPRLFYELGALVIAVVGGAMIVSAVWDIELTTLFGALGVGSVVLGLALQNVIGGLASGLIVLSGRHFAIGDWLQVGGAYAKIIQVDWRSVTLAGADGERIVVPSGELAKGTLRIRHDRQPVSVGTSLHVPAAYSPEKVTEALREAAESAARSMGGDGASCSLTEYAGQGIRYAVGFSVADPARAGPALGELLTRIWYVCQRHGIALPGTGIQESSDTAAERLRLLTGSGALRGPAEKLLELAESSRLERYAKGEELVRGGERSANFIIVIDGRLSLTIDGPSAPTVVEQLLPGQLLAMREMFRDSASPVGVVAEAESEVMSIPRSALLKLLDANRPLAGDIEAAMEARAELIGKFAGKKLHRVA